MSAISAPQTMPHPGRRSGAAQEPAALPARELGPLLVGMPHLSYAGLSENWLLKECGHAHWLMLAEGAGLDVPDFRDREGEKLYPAFTGLRLSAARLDRVGENARITLRSRLNRAAGATSHSSHLLLLDGETRCAVVEMASSFVRRTSERQNRSVARGHPLAIATGDGAAARQPHDLATRKFREADWTHLGFSARDPVAGEVHFTPCPRSDFNGAEFLYFASFLSIADRAEAQAYPQLPPDARACHREAFYFGNVDPGEAVIVRFRGARREGGRFSHWCQLVRERDAFVMANLFTQRSLEGDVRL